MHPEPTHGNRLGIYGYGEIGHALAMGLRAQSVPICAYHHAPQRPSVQARTEASGVIVAASLQELSDRSDTIVALMQGRSALEAARDIAPMLRAGQHYIDFTTASPRIKIAVAAALSNSPATVTDGAIEGSPMEYGHRLPVLLSGASAQELSRLLKEWGLRPTVIGENIGQAAAVKSLRNILIKGQMALLVESAVAADYYGVHAQLFESVAKWYDEVPFLNHVQRTLRTITVHAARRGQEAAMAEEMLAEAGVPHTMTSAAKSVLDGVALLELREKLGEIPPATAQEAVALLRCYKPV